MFEKFTSHAVMVVALAMEEAFDLEQNYCGTEHLLVGLIAGKPGLVSNTLSKRGVGLENVRAEIDNITNHQTVHSINRKPFSLKHIRDGSYSSRNIGFTPRCKSVILLASEAAQQTNIDTKHLLLGIIKEGQGVAAKVLVNLGLDFDELQTEIENASEGEPEDRIQD